MFSTNLLHLLHLSDPALPIGGFSHSAALETYVQAGIVKDKESAKEFVVQQLSQNICFTDAAFVSLAFDAASNNDSQTIIQLDELCTAVKLPREMREASKKLGTRLLSIFRIHETTSIAYQYKQALQRQKAFGHYCIAFGLMAPELNITKTEALTGFYYNAASGFVSNCIKLIPLGQHDGQQILMSLFELIEKLVTISLSPDKNLIGYCCSSFDIRSMQHEQLYTRLYMS